MDEILLHHIHEGVLTLTLNRPQAYNAFTEALARTLQAQLDAANLNPDVRAIVITGAGKAFSAGQDLGELAGPDAPPMEQILREHFNPVVAKIRVSAKPVIASVNGVAAGAGANIALACDIVLASDQASFIQAFSKIGLIPDSGGTWTLPRLVGWQKALALMITGDKVEATAAERMGMIYRVVPHDQLAAETQTLAQRLAQMPTRAITLTKQALERSASNSFERQLAVEDELQLIASQTSDYHEGVQAFLAKRPAKFTGA